MEDPTSTIPKNVKMIKQRTWPCLADRPRISESKTSQVTSSSFSGCYSLNFNSSRNFGIATEGNISSRVLFWVRPKDWSYGKKDSSLFSRLPRAVMLNIFSNLTEKELCLQAAVCRKWYTLSKDPSLWKKLRFSGNKAPINFIRRRLRECPQLVELNLACVPFSIVILRQACRCLTSLKSLTVKFCTALDRVNDGYPKEIPEAVMLNVLYNFPNLECINLKGTQILSSIFYQRLATLPRLKYLNLGSNQLIRSQELSSAVINSRHLQDLRLVPRCTLEGRPVLTDDDCVLIFSILKDNLLSLKFDAEGLGDKTFECIFKCKKLHTLSIENATLLSEDFLPLIALITNLRTLKISNAYFLSSDAFEKLFRIQDMRRLKQLTLLTCCHLSDKGLEAIAETCSALEHLSVQSCKRLTDEGVAKIIQHCKCLRRLNVAYLNRLDGWCFEFIPEHLPTLRELLIEAQVNDEKKEALEFLKREFPELQVSEIVSEFGSNLHPLT